MRPRKIDETFPIWRPLHVSFARGLGSNALGVVRDNLDVELALVRRVKEKKQLVQGRWVEVRRRSVNLYKVSKNLLYSLGSVITASIFMGEPHLTHTGVDLLRIPWQSTVPMQLCSPMSRQSNQGCILVVFQANQENRGVSASTHPEPAVQHRASRTICPECVRSTAGAPSP